MKIYNLFRAFMIGKKIYIVSNGEKHRLTMGKSLEQCESKYRGWKVKEFGKWWKK